jgi:hypothetical protein
MCFPPAVKCSVFYALFSVTFFPLLKIIQNLVFNFFEFDFPHINVSVNDIFTSLMLVPLASVSLSEISDVFDCQDIYQTKLTSCLYRTPYKTYVFIPKNYYI